MSSSSGKAEADSFHTGDAAEAFGSFFSCLAGANLDRGLYSTDILEVLRRAEPLLHAPGLGSFFSATALPVVAPVQANTLVHWILEHFVRRFRNYWSRCRCRCNCLGWFFCSRRWRSRPFGRDTGNGGKTVAIALVADLARGNQFCRR